MRHGGGRQLGLVAATVLVLVAMLMPGAVFGQEGAATPVPVTGYYYVVSRGETWGSIARKMGVTVAELQANNPQAMRPNSVLWVGDRLYVPNAPASAPSAQATTVVTPAGRAGGYWYGVKSGDTWAKVARATGVSIQRLWQANPTLLDANRWLYRGQKVWIPAAEEAAAPAPTATMTEAPTATATEAPTAEPTATATEVPAVAPTATATVAAAEPVAVEVFGLAGVAQALATAAAAAESAESASSLEAAANAVATAAAAAQSAVATITAAQAALAEQSAVTAATAVPTATKVAPTATPVPTATKAPAATPVPTATKVAAATAAPTAATAAANDVCLLDKVLAANRVFDLWGQEGFQPAILAYQIVLADTTSVACGEADGELALLRDFARYRMMLSYIGLGQGNQATALRAQMETPVLRGAADAFLNSLKTSGSIVQACRDTTKFATANPAAWEWLVDLGVEFKPSDLCPLG